ncbi:MAG: hypothetical protein ACI4OS_07925 [Akkermansia sp.]
MRRLLLCTALLLPAISPAAPEASEASAAASSAAAPAASASSSALPPATPAAASPAAPAPPDSALRATVYFEVGSDTEELSRRLTPLRKRHPQQELRFVALAPACRTMHDAVNAAQAMVAGVAELPALVLGDEQGDFAALPLRELTPEALRTAELAAEAPQRAEVAAERRYRAKEYLLFARMALAQPMSDEIAELCLTSCRALMNHPSATPADRQLLGLRCLYPLLMQQYARGYRGAHTPETEAKLLEAIAALEAARDTDPNSTLGKQAFAERERLRAARRKARLYE